MVKKMKIVIYDNNKCVIEDYNTIKKIENESIIIDFYQVSGKNLKIKQMNDYLIVINGIIEHILIGDSFEI